MCQVYSAEPGGAKKRLLHHQIQYRRCNVRAVRYLESVISVLLLPQSPAPLRTLIGLAPRTRSPRPLRRLPPLRYLPPIRLELALSYTLLPMSRHVSGLPVVYVALQYAGSTFLPSPSYFYSEVSNNPPIGARTATDDGCNSRRSGTPPGLGPFASRRYYHVVDHCMCR